MAKYSWLVNWRVAMNTMLALRCLVVRICSADRGSVQRLRQPPASNTEPRRIARRGEDLLPAGTTPGCRLRVQRGQETQGLPLGKHSPKLCPLARKACAKLLERLIVQIASTPVIAEQDLGGPVRTDVLKLLVRKCG